MELNITLKKICPITKGRLLKGNPSFELNSFSTDTRTIKKGGVFWALKGKSFDGNDFIGRAVENGASGLICRRRGAGAETLSKISFCVEVPDTLKALHALALSRRLKFRIPVISVTGSNGKTTAKEMIKAVLETKGPVCSNTGNFNNEFGLPFSVLELGKKHKAAVFELGASRRGEVLELAKIIRPGAAVITTIGPEHLEFFKSMENIFKTETEVLQSLKGKNSPVIYNGDNEYLKRLDRRRLNRLTFGFEKGSDLLIKEEGKGFVFVFRNRKTPIKLKIPGRHNYLNAAAAFLAGLAAGVRPGAAIKALENFKGVPMRMQAMRIKKAEILFDAYNANPQSMEAALSEITGRGGRYFLVLGDMKELGKYSRAYHRELGEKLRALDPAGTVLIGGEMKAAYALLKGKKENVKYFTETGQARKEIRRLLYREKAVFLFKASRSMRFEKLLQGGRTG